MFSALRWQAPSVCQAGPACWMDPVFLTPCSRGAEVLRLLEKGPELRRQEQHLSMGN